MNISYIIPTIARTTLLNSIQSIYSIDKTANVVIVSGGLVGDNRNKGLKMMAADESVDWVGFLDDDDYFINDFKQELSDSYDLVIMRMNQEGKLIPRVGSAKLSRGNVGINFFINMKFIRDKMSKMPLFDNRPEEDWRFIKTILDNPSTPRVKVTEKVYYMAPRRNKSVESMNMNKMG